MIDAARVLLIAVALAALPAVGCNGGGETDNARHCSH